MQRTNQPGDCGWRFSSRSLISSPLLLCRGFLCVYQYKAGFRAPVEAKSKTEMETRCYRKTGEADHITRDMLEEEERRKKAEEERKQVIPSFIRAFLRIFARAYSCVCCDSSSFSMRSRFTQVAEEMAVKRREEKILAAIENAKNKGGGKKK